MRVAAFVSGLVLCALFQAPALAAGGGGGGGGGGDGNTTTSAKVDPQYREAAALIQNHQYAKAIPLLNAYVARVSSDADAENLLGYANRKAGNVQVAFTHYNRALQLDPKHKDAHEYIGEAYLMTGNLAKAEEHLKILDRLCVFSCDQYRDLKASIAQYKAKQAGGR
jgi:tetratricopeptide (TPR) repeat protein